MRTHLFKWRTVGWIAVGLLLVVGIVYAQDQVGSEKATVYERFPPCANCPNGVLVPLAYSVTDGSVPPAWACNEKNCGFFIKIPWGYSTIVSGTYPESE